MKNDSSRRILDSYKRDNSERSFAAAFDNQFDPNFSYKSLINSIFPSRKNCDFQELRTNTPGWVYFVFHPGGFMNTKEENQNFLREYAN